MSFTFAPPPKSNSSFPSPRRTSLTPFPKVLTTASGPSPSSSTLRKELLVSCTSTFPSAASSTSVKRLGENTATRLPEASRDMLNMSSYFLMTRYSSSGKFQRIISPVAEAPTKDDRAGE